MEINQEEIEKVKKINTKTVILHELAITFFVIAAFFYGKLVVKAESMVLVMVLIIGNFLLSILIIGGKIELIRLFRNMPIIAATGTIIVAKFFIDQSAEDLLFALLFFLFVFHPLYKFKKYCHSLLIAASLMVEMVVIFSTIMFFI